MAAAVARTRTIEMRTAWWSISRGWWCRGRDIDQFLCWAGSMTRLWRKIAALFWWRRPLSRDQNFFKKGRKKKDGHMTTTNVEKITKRSQSPVRCWKSSPWHGRRLRWQINPQRSLSANFIVQNEIDRRHRPVLFSGKNNKTFQRKSVFLFGDSFYFLGGSELFRGGQVRLLLVG